MRRLVLGTAGHIDHGKTALVRALTGVDTDRLPEEKRRGITIDLGFASLLLDDDVELGIVDVPGHEAFIRNMLAGASGIDLVLLVVAADEGVMPQTREHLAIVELLGIGRGVVALTKADLVEPEWLELVRDEVRELLAGGPLADAPVCAVSARTGEGLQHLQGVLRDATRILSDRPHDDLFRMPIDRVFTVRGTGTVVTGTVWSGRLDRDAQVRIQPAGLGGRVRALQRHGEDCDSVSAGQRAAIALAGVDRHALTRGDTLLDRADWLPASILTVQLTVLPDAPAALRPRQRVRVHLGTAEVLARLALPDGEVPPGGQALGQLRLEQPLIARALDRVVLRSYSPVHTVAGACVLEAAAPKRKRFAPAVRAALTDLMVPDRSLAVVIALGSDGVPIHELPVRSGRPAGPLLAAAAAAPGLRIFGDRIFPADAILDARDVLLGHVRAHHEQRPLEDGIDRELLRRRAGAIPALTFDAAFQDLLADGTFVVSGCAIALSGYRAAPAAAHVALLQRLTAAYAAAGVQSPELHELPPDLASAPDLPLLIRLLERSGALVRLGGARWIDAAALASAVSAIYAQFEAGQRLGIPDFRQVLNLSRKHLIPLLEYLDRAGVTVRTGDDRVLQPAAPVARTSHPAVAEPA
jgi:selenocysteine-specific elongation factor